MRRAKRRGIPSYIYTRRRWIIGNAKTLHHAHHAANTHKVRKKNQVIRKDVAIAIAAKHSCFSTMQAQAEVYLADFLLLPPPKKTYRSTQRAQLQDIKCF